MKRNKGEEALSVGFYVIIAIYVLVFAGIIVALNCFGWPEVFDLNILSALIAAASALIGFHITIFTMYFSFGMKESLKRILIDFGFYMQIPKDIVRTIFVYVVCVFSALTSYVMHRWGIVPYETGVALSITSFVAGLTLTIYVTLRFFKIVFENRNYDLV